MNWKTLCFASLGLSVALVGSFNPAPSQAGATDSMSGSMSGQSMKSGCDSMQSPGAMSSHMTPSTTPSTTSSSNTMSDHMSSSSMSHSTGAMSSSSMASSMTPNHNTAMSGGSAQGSTSCDMMHSPSSPSVNPGATSR